MKVLLVEDEAELAESITSYLKENSFICELAKDAESALTKISLHNYDCVLLDLALPDGNGFDILNELKRENRTEGIIIVSAKDAMQTKIEGLNLGADDYLAKPFHLAELHARIQAILRRKNFNGNNVVRFCEIEIDMLSKSVTVSDKPVELTKKELELLLFMIGNQRKVLSKASIAEHISGDMANMLDNHDFIYAHVKNLKRKLHEAGCADYIRTIYGLGYKWQS